MIRTASDLNQFFHQFYFAACERARAGEEYRPPQPMRTTDTDNVIPVSAAAPRPDLQRAIDCGTYKHHGNRIFRIPAEKGKKSK